MSRFDFPGKPSSTRRIQPAASRRARLNWIVRSWQRDIAASVAFPGKATALSRANRRRTAIVVWSRGLSLMSSISSWGTAEK